MNAEEICIKKFAGAQLKQAKGDIGSFSEVVYELSAIHMGVGMWNSENMNPTPAPAVVPTPEQNIAEESNEEGDLEIGRLLYRRPK